MRKISRIAMGVAAAAVTLTGMASGAAAQERRNRDRGNQAAAQPAISRAFAQAYAPVNEAITASNADAADAALPALRAAAQSPYEQYITAQTDLRIAGLRNDNARQRAAIVLMSDSPALPAADAPRVHLAAGQLAYNARDYADAAARFERARAAGSTEANIDLLRVDALIRAGQVDQGLAITRGLIEQARAGNGTVSEALISSTARALQEANRTPEMLDLLATRAHFYPTPANFKQLGIIFLQNAPDNRGMTLDVLRGMSAAGAMDDRRFYLEHAQDAAEEGLPGEAVAVIQAARAAGLAQASDRSFNEIYTLQQAKVAEDRASLAASARRAATVADARLATLTGDAYLSYGENQQALAMYELAKTKTGADMDLLNTHIGIAHFRSGNLTAADAAFAAVRGQRLTIANLWRALIASRQRPAAAPAATTAPTPPAAPAI